MATVAILASGHPYVEFIDYEDADEFDDFLVEEKDIEAWQMDVQGKTRIGFPEGVSLDEAEKIFQEFEGYRKARASRG